MGSCYFERWNYEELVVIDAKQSKNFRFTIYRCVIILDQPPAELLPWLLEEFPYLHLSTETLHDMWRRSARQLQHLSKAEESIRHKKNNAQIQVNHKPVDHVFLPKTPNTQQCTSCILLLWDLQVHVIFKAVTNFFLCVFTSGGIQLLKLVSMHTDNYDLGLYSRTSSDKSKPTIYCNFYENTDPGIYTSNKPNYALSSNALVIVLFSLPDTSF